MTYQKGDGGGHIQNHSSQEKAIYGNCEIRAVLDLVFNIRIEFLWMENIKIDFN